MGYPNAGQYEIIRSAHKDEQVCSQLRLSASDLSQHFLGAKVWLKHRQKLEIATDVAYFFLTTLKDLQTIGEEYVHLLQVDSTKRQLPSKLRRTCMIFFQVVGPYLINKSLKDIEKNSKSPEFVSGLRSVLKFIHQFHLAWFYLNGGHYHVSKRLTNINYVIIRDWLRFNAEQHVFRILGVLIAAQLLLECTVTAKSWWPVMKHLDVRKFWTFDFYRTDTEKTVSRSSSVNVPSLEKCPLCLDRRDHTTCTQCGHLFCWKCIISWMQTNSHCPICREALHPSTVVPLNNYDRT